MHPYAGIIRIRFLGYYLSLNCLVLAPRASIHKCILFLFNNDDSCFYLKVQLRVCWVVRTPFRLSSNKAKTCDW